MDPKDRELIMSCGAALFNLRLALRRFGNRDTVTLLPDVGNPDLLARVTLDGQLEPTDSDIALFNAIRARHTFRLPFRRQAPNVQLLDALEVAAVQEGAWLHVVDGDSPRTALADLIAEADRRQMADRRFRRELAAWTHANRSRTTDGMLAVLGTTGDTPRDWLAAGQALEHVLLRAQVEGVSASFLNQPVEVPELRLEVQVLTGFMGFPQIVLRLGYGGEAGLSPRRPVEEVLLA